MDRWDAMAAAGLALMGGGLWWVYPPAALIVCGLALLALGVAGAKNKEEDEVQNDGQQRQV